MPLLTVDEAQNKRKSYKKKLLFKEKRNQTVVDIRWWLEKKYILALGGSKVSWNADLPRTLKSKQVGAYAAEALPSPPTENSDDWKHLFTTLWIFSR